jgi:hypothetical protein
LCWWLWNLTYKWRRTVEVKKINLCLSNYNKLCLSLSQCWGIHDFSFVYLIQNHYRSFFYIIINYYITKLKYTHSISLLISHHVVNISFFPLTIFLQMSII